MSSDPRGCVAVGTIDKWTGVYNKAGSLPSRLGRDSWDILHNIYKGNVNKFTEELLEYERWDDFVEKKTKMSHEHISSEDPNPLFIEWVYVYNPDEKTFAILATNFKEASRNPQVTVEVGKDGFYDYGNVKCKHDLLMLFDIDGKEPDWEAIEKIRD
jgi:hypothetical protein